MYIIRDKQFACGYFADGKEFKTKKDILDQLVSYHSIDFSDALRDNDERTIQEFMDSEFKTSKDKLNFILEYGQWGIEAIKK